MTVSAASAYVAGRRDFLGHRVVQVAREPAALLLDAPQVGDVAHDAGDALHPATVAGE